MEQVVAQWRRPVASGEALVMPHWAMRSVLHRRTAMTIEMARDGGPPVIVAKDYRMVH